MGLSQWPDGPVDPNSKLPGTYVTIEVEAVVRASTEKAIGLFFRGGGYNQKLLWVPKSVIDGTVPKRDQIVTEMRVAQWWAIDNGFDCESDEA